MLAIPIGVVLLGLGLFLVVRSSSIFERSKRPGARWRIPEGQRLTVIRGMGGFYAFLGFLILYKALRG